MTTAIALEVPRRRRARPMWMRALGYFLTQFERTWRESLAMNFVFPVLYLTAMGVGLGSLVNHHLATSRAAALGGAPYLAFIAPGILSASAMQIAMQEATWPVYGAISWDRAYVAMLQTPLQVRDVFRGHLAFMTIRFATTTAIFLGVCAAFGAIPSVEAIAALPVGILVGLAFGAPIAAFSVRQTSDAAFTTMNRLFIIPLFLFSGSFFPVAQLPIGLRVIAVITPLYHGVALARAATLGHLWAWGSLVHLGYLVVLVVVGVVVAGVSYEKRLRP